MLIAVIGLMASYVILVVLLVSLNLRSDWHWGVKAGAIVVVTAFFPICYLSLESLLGWPTSQPLPERFRLVAAQVYEPNKQTGYPGEIFIWAASMATRAGQVTPRAYGFPYEDVLHMKISEAVKSQRKGVPQMGKLVREDSSGFLGKVRDFSRFTSVSDNIAFYDLPGTVLPEK